MLAPMSWSEAPPQTVESEPSIPAKTAKVIPGSAQVPKEEMKKSTNPDFADRLNASADAKKARLELLEKAKAAASTPEFLERQAARAAVAAAREARTIERKAAKLAAAARAAEELAAAQAAEAAAREIALRAEQEAREAEYAEQLARKIALEAEQQAARDARYAARKARKRKGR
jgi:hypothetical protein